MDFTGLAGVVVSCAAAIAWVAGIVLPFLLDSAAYREAKRKGAVR